MEFSNYEQQSYVTAQYPGRGKLMGLLYCALGLAGEAGEFVDQIKKVLRDDEMQLTEIRLDKLCKELGDVLWYLSNAAYEISMLRMAHGASSPVITLELIARHNIEKLQDRQARGVLCGDGGMR